MPYITPTKSGQLCCLAKFPQFGVAQGIRPYALCQSATGQKAPFARWHFCAGVGLMPIVIVMLKKASCTSVWNMAKRRTLEVKI